MKRPRAAAVLALVAAACPAPLSGQEAGAGFAFGTFQPLMQRFNQIYGPGVSASVRAARGRGSLHLVGEMSVLVDDGFGEAGYDTETVGPPDTYLSYLSGILAKATYRERYNRSGTPVPEVGWTEMKARIVLVPLSFGFEWRPALSARANFAAFVLGGPIVGYEAVSGSYMNAAKKPSLVSNQISLGGAELRLGARFSFPLKRSWSGFLEAVGSGGALVTGRRRDQVKSHRVDLRAGLAYSPPPPTPTPRLTEPASPSPTVVPLGQSAAQPTPTPTPRPRGGSR